MGYGYGSGLGCGLRFRARVRRNDRAVAAVDREVRVGLAEDA